MTDKIIIYIEVIPESFQLYPRGLYGKWLKLCSEWWSERRRNYEWDFVGEIRLENKWNVSRYFLASGSWVCLIWAIYSLSVLLLVSSKIIYSVFLYEKEVVYSFFSLTSPLCLLQHIVSRETQLFKLDLIPRKTFFSR